MHVAECVGTCVPLTDSYQRDVGKHAATGSSEKHVILSAAAHSLDGSPSSRCRARFGRAQPSGSTQTVETQTSCEKVAVWEAKDGGE